MQADLSPLEDKDVVLFTLDNDHDIAQALADNKAAKHKELHHGLRLVAEVYPSLSDSDAMTDIKERVD